MSRRAQLWVVIFFGLALVVGIYRVEYVANRQRDNFAQHEVIDRKFGREACAERKKNHNDLLHVLLLLLDNPSSEAARVNLQHAYDTVAAEPITCNSG